MSQKQVTVRDLDGALSVVLVSKNDYAYAKKHTWYMNTNANGKAYARSLETGEYLHRVIAGARAGERVFFLNGDEYDCRRSNLLCVRRSIRVRSDRNKAFHAVPVINGKTFDLGSYYSKTAARQAIADFVANR